MVQTDSQENSFSDGMGNYYNSFNEEKHFVDDTHISFKDST
jgi:hypothetical protein